MIFWVKLGNVQDPQGHLIPSTTIGVCFIAVSRFCTHTKNLKKKLKFSPFDVVYKKKPQRFLSEAYIL